MTKHNINQSAAPVVWENQNKLSIQDLEQLGFTKDYDRVHEPEFSYESYTISMGESYMSITFEFDLNNKITKYYLTINDRDFSGRAPTKKDLETLKELMMDLTVNTNIN